MCGIAGFFDLSIRESVWNEILKGMTDAIAHRGPDDEGCWGDPAAGIFLGHRRLSIIDLSPAGHQPMLSSNGRYVMVYNGEIYNYLDIRHELEVGAPLTLRGSSDTEIMLEAFDRWGVQSTIERCVGMFAFAVWDRQERRLYLGRDRCGEKPLYYGWMGQAFLFGSELKALHKHPCWQGEIHRDALALYMRHGYIPTPHSIFKNIYKLPPATILCLDNFYPGELPSPVPFWSAKASAELGKTHPFTGTDDEALDQLELLLKRSVRQQMIADVPLGAFLSGGIDSSTVVALMQAQSNRPVKTFSIGFEEAGFDEAPYAKAVARHLGTDHTELYITPEEAMAVIPKLPTLYDEPFADSSQIPTYLVSRLARQHVTVSLSGDGGDELFAGYTRYSTILKMYDTGDKILGVKRRLFQTAFHLLSPTIQRHLVQIAKSPLIRARARAANDAYFLATTLEQSPEAAYRALTLSHWKEPERVVLGASEPKTVLNDPSQWPDVAGLVDRLTYFDVVTYLPDDILVKVDRASMGVSLESRVPMLDHRVVEFAQCLPSSMKIRNGQSKWLLRQLLYRYVPAKLVERPKMGFGVPIETWLRTDLKDWAESLLDEQKLEADGILAASIIRQTWADHLARRSEEHYRLWNILMFQAWKEAWS